MMQITRSLREALHGCRCTRFPSFHTFAKMNPFDTRLAPFEALAIRRGPELSAGDNFCGSWFTLIGTFLFTVWLGRRFGVDRKLVELIAAGTSICGDSAIIATNAVTRASDEDVAYAVACVTVFGSASMLLYPIFFGGPAPVGPACLWAVGRRLGS